MRTAIATAIIVAIGLDVVATAIGADKVGKETHWLLRVGWYGSNIRNELQGRKRNVKLFFRLT
jgi:hypothetical protein